MSPYEKDRHATDKFGYRTTTDKKNGGGAHSWGKVDDQETCPAAIDKNDPNYDSDEEKEKKQEQK